MSPSRRAAIVGIGVKAPGGSTPATFWETVCRGEGRAERLDHLRGGYEVTAAPVGCRVSDDDTSDERYFRKPELRRIDPVARFGVAAAQDALGDLGGRVPPERRAAVVGTGVGGLSTYKTQVEVVKESGIARCSPFTVPMMMPNALAGWLSLKYDLRGACNTIAAACASAAAAIGEAMLQIRTDRADLVIAGGSEAVLFPEVFLSFARMEALAKESDLPPEAASRPFDVRRSGFVLGEGAAMVALVAAETAAAEGLEVLGWVDGYGCSSDAHHMVAPPEDGHGGAQSMRSAIDDAGLSPADITHVNAHGTSTPLNDPAESVALHTVFGDDGPPVTSTKGVTGHLLGATGAVEAVAALVAGATGVVPPVANTDAVDPEITADVVVGEPRAVRPGPALSNSFAFGGHNVSLVITPAPEADSLLREHWDIGQP